jgi:hypothetical protein
MGKLNFFFGTLPFNPWAILTTWLHVGALKKYKKNEFTTHFERLLHDNYEKVKIIILIFYKCNKHAVLYKCNYNSLVKSFVHHSQIYMQCEILFFYIKYSRIFKNSLKIV